MFKNGVAVLLLSGCFLSIAAATAAGPRPPFSAQRLDPPKLLKRVEPVYPEGAQQARIQGVVTVEATIGPDGKVKTAKITGSIFVDLALQSHRSSLSPLGASALRLKVTAWGKRRASVPERFWRRTTRG
jgi:hypothetical protein